MKAFPVIGGRPVLVECGDMFRGGVAFVVCPIVCGKFIRQAAHELIAMRLGEDGSGSDGKVGCVAFDDAAEGDLPSVSEVVAVHQHKLGSHRKLSDCKVHGMYGRVKDVHPVDVRFRYLCDGVCQSVTLDDFTKRNPFLLRKLLGVVDVIVGIAVWKNDGGSADRAGETTTSYFITSAFECRGRGKVGF